MQKQAVYIVNHQMQTKKCGTKLELTKSEAFNMVDGEIQSNAKGKLKINMKNMKLGADTKIPGRWRHGTKDNS